MEHTVYLLDMFSGYQPDETTLSIWQQAAVCSADIDAADRSVTVNVQSDTYITVEQIADLEQKLKRAYGLGSLTLKCGFPQTVKTSPPCGR